MEGNNCRDFYRVYLVKYTCNVHQNLEHKLIEIHNIFVVQLLQSYFQALALGTIKWLFKSNSSFGAQKKKKKKKECIF